MTKKSKLVLGLASMLGVSAGATAVSGFAWFTTTKQATVSVTNIGVYSKSSALDVTFVDALTNKNVEGGVLTDGTLTIKAKGTEVVETFSGTGSITDFELKQTPYTNPTVSIGGVAQASGWSLTGKTISFTSAPAEGTNNISVTYSPREVLTDVSSVDGQHIYKPTWTASGEGRYATAMPVASDGYLQFTMRLRSTGASPLEVFLNAPTITPATNGANDTAAANISRVAIIEDTTTKLVLQNSILTNTKGISPDDAADGGKNWEFDGGHAGYDGWDLANNSPACVTDVDEDIFTATGSPSKNNLSSAPAHADADDARDNNYVCHIDASSYKDIKVVVWLEGTSSNATGDASGAYATETNPLNGLFSVSLPLIAF